MNSHIRCVAFNADSGRAEVGTIADEDLIVADGHVARSDDDTDTIVDVASGRRSRAAVVAEP